MFTIPGIGVHHALEWMFTFGWNLRSRCPGIHTKMPAPIVRSIRELEGTLLYTRTIDRP